MLYKKLNSVKLLIVPGLFFNRHRLVSVRLAIFVLLVNYPLLSSTNPIEDKFGIVTNMNLMVVNSYFDRLSEDIKALVVAAVNEETNVAASVTTSAEELVKISRKRRSQFEDGLPFVAPKSCSLTKNGMKQIIHLLQGISRNEVSNKTSCGIKEGKSANVNITGLPEHCNRMIESIIWNVNDVKNAFRCLSKTTAALTDHRYEELKAIYETKVIQLELQLENAEKKFDQKFKKEIDKLMKRYHEMEKKMRETLEELQKERLAHSDVNITLIVEYLESGKLHSAWDMFKAKTMGIGNNNIALMVKRVIGKSFTANVPIINVIRFTEGLKDNVDVMVRGVISVFNELEKRQNLDPDTVDLLYVTIEDVIKTCINLEGTDSEESQLTVDKHMLDQLIVVNNKIEFLKYTYG